MQVPGYLEHSDALKAVGITEVIVFCVNDGAVMQAWAKDQGVGEDSIVTMMGDPYGEVTKLLGIELTADGPKGLGLVGRCKRTAIVLDDGVVKTFTISEAEDDPAGDDRPEATCAPAVIEAVKGLQLKGEL